MGFRLHGNVRAPPIGDFEPILVFFLDDETTRREVRSWMNSIRVSTSMSSSFPTLEHIDDGIDHFAEIVRWDGGRHTDGNTRRTVDQEIGQCGRQHFRFLSACRRSWG